MHTVHYNNPSFGDQRSSVEKLTLEEEEKTIQFINDLLRCVHNSNCVVMPKSVENLQKFIYNYENANHFRTVNGNVDYLREKALIADKIQLIHDTAEEDNFSDFGIKVVRVLNSEF